MTQLLWMRMAVGLVGSLGLLGAGVRDARAEETSAAVQALTEEDVVARALGRGALVDAITGKISAESGRARTAGAYPNPDVSYSRERVPGTEGSTEDRLTLAQPIDLGGRYGLRARAGEARAEAARKGGDAARLSVATEARQRFYDLLFRQQRVNAVATWAEQVRVALAAVILREERGDVATYDRRRLEREQAAAAGRLANEVALLGRARARLQAILGEVAPITVAGTLIPSADPPPLEEARSRSRSRPDLVAFDLVAQAHDLEGRAAGRWWVPPLTLEGGWKSVLPGAPSSDRADGYVAGVTLSLPLWDRQRGLAQTAEGEARSARGQRALLETELQGELAGAREEAVSLRKAGIELREQVRSASADVVRMSSLGYQAGELGILELLDAYRGGVEDELSALDMEHGARLARIELDQLVGAALP